MTDDIVNRLRYIYSQKDVGVSVNPETFTEAADEIERLRIERDQFRKFWSYAINERDGLFDTAFPTNKNYTSFIHPDAKKDL